MKHAWIAVVVLGLAEVWCGPCADAFEGMMGQSYAQCRASSRPWHAPFYHVMWGQPVALVVPPTAEMETNYHWGVCGTEVTRIDHQFSRRYPGPYYGGVPLMPTPPWPSDTRQFGVYYVRGPW